MGYITLAQTQKRHTACDKVDARSQVGSQADWAKVGSSQTGWGMAGCKWGLG